MAVLFSGQAIVNASNEQQQHYGEATTSTVRFLLFCPLFYSLFFSLVSLFFSLYRITAIVRLPTHDLLLRYG